jgi:hypothetical protein
VRRAVWWSAIASIALAPPVVAQRGDTLYILPEVRSPQWVARTPDVVERGFVGDLRVALVRAGDDGTTTPLTAADLARMHVTQTNAFSIAFRNLRLKLMPFSLELPAASSELSGMRSVEGAPFETSRLLLAEDWRELERRLGGPIVAVAPITGSLIFGRDTITPISRRKSVPAAQFLEISAGVLMPYGKRADILSATVLRWTATGWKVVPPMTEAERLELNRRPPEAESAGVPDEGTPATTAPAAAASPPLFPPPKASTTKPATKPKKP